MRIDLSGQSPSTLLNEREVAAAIFVSVKTLQYWRQRDEGPPFLRLGRHVRYRAGEVAQWLEQQRG